MCLLQKKKIGSEGDTFPLDTNVNITIPYYTNTQILLGIRDYSYWVPYDGWPSEPTPLQHRNTFSNVSTTYSAQNARKTIINLIMIDFAAQKRS